MGTFGKAIGAMSTVVQAVNEPESPPELTEPPTLPKIPEKEIEGMKNVSKNQREEFTAENRKKTKAYLNFTHVKSEKISNESRKSLNKMKESLKTKDEEYNRTLGDYEKKKSEAKERLQTFQNHTAAQKAQYDRSKILLASMTNLTDEKKQHFEKLLAAQEAQYNLSEEHLKKVEQLSKAQEDHFKNVSEQFQELSEKQMEKIDGLSDQVGNLSKQQAQSFDDLTKGQTEHFDTLKSQMEKMANESTKGFDDLHEQQTKVLTNISQEMQEIKVTKEEQNEQLGLLSQLVSEGFVKLQNRMEGRFQKVEQLLDQVKETALFLAYESDVQLKLKPIQVAYQSFVEQMGNISVDPKLTDTALAYLVQKCCQNPPYEIMSTIYHTAAGVAKLQEKNLINFIWDSYFSKDSKRMLSLYNFIMDDVFNTAQLVTVCDEVTNGFGNGVEKSSISFKNYPPPFIISKIQYVLEKYAIQLGHLLDAKTSSMEPSSDRMLVEDASVMNDIIKEYSQQYPDIAYNDLGCEKGKESGNEFASFAVNSLRKRFHFFKFFVVVGRYNYELMDRAVPFKCSKHHMNYFRYTKKHSKSYRQKLNESYQTGESKIDAAEKIAIITSYIQENVTTDTDCLSKIKLDCNYYEPTNVYNAVACVMKSPFYICGMSYSTTPNYKKVCFSGTNNTMFAVCA